MIIISVALIIIDVQVAMFSKQNPVFKGEDLLKTIKLLIEKSRTNHVPIFYIQHNARPGKPLERGSSGWAIHESISPKPQDIILEKRTPDSFLETNLLKELMDRAIQTIILCGIQTELCIDTTCRRARSLGLNVLLVQDGHSTWNRGELIASQIIDHHNDLLRWFADVKIEEDIDLEKLCR